MTIGEMNKWTQRFLQIIGGAQVYKQQRLEQMKRDLDQAYRGKQVDPFALQMYAAVIEEMG